MASDQPLIDQMRGAARCPVPAPCPQTDAGVGRRYWNGRREPKAKQMAERKDMTGNAASIGIIPFDREIGTVVKQAIEVIRCLARPGALASD
jgi:hypothetical protein